MKSTMTRWMIAAAALAAFAGSAAAQTYKAEIPLAFHVRDKLMQPGEYRIEVHGTSGVASFVLYNSDAKTSAILIAAKNASVSRAWHPDVPVLVFECTGSDCALSKLWNGSDSAAYLFPRPRARYGDMRTTVIGMTPVKAE